MNEIISLDNAVYGLIAVVCFVAFIPAMLVVGVKLFKSYVKLTMIILGALFVAVPSVLIVNWLVDKEESKYELKVERPIPKAIIVNEK